MNRRQYLKFLIVYAIFSMAANFAHPVTPTLIVERHLDSSMFGIALAAMFVMSFLFSPFWGKLCSYIPTKTIILIGGLGYCVGQVIFGAAVNEAMVVGGRMVAGAFSSGAWTAALNYVVNTSKPEDRGQNLTVYATLQNVISAVGYFIGGMLGLISVEFTFTVQVVMLAAGCILLFFVCVDDTPFKHRPERKLSFADANPFRVFVEAKDFMNFNFVLIFAMVAIAAVGQNSFEQVFNYFIKDQFQLSSAYNGIFKAAIALCGFIANSTVCMWLVKKTDINKTYAWVMIAATIPAGLILFFFGSIIPFAVCDILFMTINIIRNPIQQNLCAEHASAENSNSVMGFFQAMNSLGGIFGAAFAGLIYDTNTHYPFILAFAADLITSARALFYRARYSRTEGKAA